MVATIQAATSRGHARDEFQPSAFALVGLVSDPEIEIETVVAMYSAQESTSRWVGAVRDAGVAMGRGAITGREDHCSGFQDFSHSISLLLRSFTFIFTLNPWREDRR